MDNNNVKYRHELKYVASQMELALIKNRLDHVISLDSHVKEQGIYTIRSLYFDDYANRCYEENESGTDPREKFRIRIYNGSASKITLELKKKERGKTLKLSCPLTEEQCRTLMRGIPLPHDVSYPPLLQKLLMQMRTRLLKPVVIVEYDRVPYVYRMEDANVRVTFDMNLTSSENIEDFLEERIDGRGIFAVDELLMEVKYDDFLPDEINSLLQLEGLSASTFSKYYLCRKFKG